jgi:hypothetical protein
MFSPLFARLLRHHSRTPAEPNRASSRGPTRLRVEALEPREVPAHLVWTNATGTGFFGIGANWFNLDTNRVAMLAPGADDDLYFDGDVSDASCDGMLEPIKVRQPKLGDLFIEGDPPVGGDPLIGPDQYHSVNLIDGYSGTVAAPTGFRTGRLVIESGAIAQTAGSCSDIWVSQAFLWTGGTLGGSHAGTGNPDFVASNSTLHLLGGSTSIIDPGAGQTVATGSTLSFEAEFGAGSTATFYSGTVAFVGGLGVVIDALCTVNAEVSPATAKFVDTPQPGATAKLITIKTGGKMYVRGADGGTFDSAIPVMNFGLFQVEKNATAIIRGAIPLGNAATDPSFYQDTEAAAIKIENGSKLVTEKGLSFLNGTLATLANANPPQGFAQTATVSGKVSLSGGHVYVCENTNPHVFGTLVFESDVWLGAVTLHVVVDGRAPGTGDAGKSDVFDFKAGLLDGLAQPVLKVKTINTPQGGVNQNQTWEFVKAASPITALKPTVVSETPGVNFQIIDVDQNKKWRLQPTA